jgi:hypothetical protein
MLAITLLGHHPTGGLPMASDPLGCSSSGLAPYTSLTAAFGKEGSWHKYVLGFGLVPWTWIAAGLPLGPCAGALRRCSPAEGVADAAADGEVGAAVDAGGVRDQDRKG